MCVEHNASSRFTGTYLFLLIYSMQCCGSGMVYPGSGSRIRIPDPGGKKHRIPDPTVHKNRDEK
jgi:hypothetical protein